MNGDKKQNRHSATLKKNVVGLIGILIVMSLTACSNESEESEKDTTSDIRQTSPFEMHESEQSAAAEEIPETESQTEMTQILEIYEGEYTGNTINDPDYDGLEIQKNEDDTYGIQVKIPFLTRLYECTGYQSENIILFSTSEWGTDKKVEGSISLDDDSATVTFTSGWYQTATAESSYQYHKTSDTPHLENCPDARPDYSSFTGEYCERTIIGACVRAVFQMRSI